LPGAEELHLDLPVHLRAPSKGGNFLGKPSEQSDTAAFNVQIAQRLARPVLESRLTASAIISSVFTLGLAQGRGESLQDRCRVNCRGHSKAGSQLAEQRGLVALGDRVTCGGYCDAAAERRAWPCQTAERSPDAVGMGE
jgi:hypothetical protein